MSARTTVTKPKIPEDVLQIDKWIDMDLAPYMSALGYDHVNGFPNSRTEAMATGADDTAAYRAVARFYADGGNTDAKKAQHKAYLDDTKAGPYLADLIRNTIHADCLDHADDKNRLTALKSRLRDSIPTPLATKAVQYSAVYQATEGHLENLATWPHHLNTHSQGISYRSKINLAVSRHVENGGTKPADKKLTERFTFGHRGILPERFTEDWIRLNVVPNEDDWPLVIKTVIAYDLERPKTSGSATQESEVFYTDHSGTANDKPDYSNLSAAQKKTTPCWHFKKAPKGCSFADKCNFSHAGNGKIRERKTSAANPNRRKGGNPNEGKNPKFKAGKYYEKAKKGNFFREVNAATIKRSADDDSDAGEDADTPPKKKKKPKGKGWFSLSGIVNVIFALSIGGIAAEPGQEQCWPVADFQQRAHQLYDEHVIHDALTVEVIEVNASAARKSSTAKKLMAIDDGGASASVKRDKHGFNSDYRLVEGHPPIRGAGGNLTQVIGVGSITVNVTTNKGLRTVVIRNVLHAPDFKVDVISHGQLKKEGFKFFDEEEETGCTTPQGLKIKFDMCQNGLHYWNCNYAAKENCTSLNDMTTKQLGRISHQCNANELLSLLNDSGVANSTQKRNSVRMKLAELGEYTANCPKSDKLLQLHCLLGHPNVETTVAYLRNTLTNAEIRKQYGSIAATFCEHCLVHKATRANIARAKTPTARATRFGQKTYTDVAGKFSTSPVAKKIHYEILFLDDCTSKATVYGLTDLTNIPAAIEKYYNYVEYVTGQSKADQKDRNLLRENNDDFNYVTGARCHSDSAAYYRSPQARSAYAKHGITWTASGPGEHHRNGVAERYWRSCHTRSGAMRAGARLGYNGFWLWSDLHATATHNLIKTDRNNGKSPNQLANELTGAGSITPDCKFPTTHHHLHTFGRSAWVTRIDNKVKGVDPARKGIYLGWNSENLSHRIYFPKSDSNRASYVESNHVRFTPGLPLLEAVEQAEVPLFTPGYVPFFGRQLDDDDSVVVVDNGGDGALDLDYFIQQGQPYAANACVKTGGIAKYDVGADCDVLDSWDTDELFAVYTTMSKIYNTKRAAYESEFGDAFKLSDMAEVRQLCTRGTISPMPLSKVPAGEQIYDSVCTRQMKCNEHGAPVKPKSRLAMNGKSQTRREPGIEFANTRTICPRMSSCRCYFSNAAAKGSTCYDFDIPNAFGQAEEDKVRFMRMPFDMRKYDKNGEEIVYRVLNLYGGRTAGRNYQDCFVSWMCCKEIGFKQNPSDPSTFYRAAKPAQPEQPARPIKRDRAGKVTQQARAKQPAVPAMAEITAFAWIDDVNYETTDVNAHKWFSDKLVAKWDPNHEKKPPSKTDFVIGIKVVQSNRKITLLQPQLATKLLEPFPQVHSKKTPFKTGQNTAMCDEGDLLSPDQQKLYRRGSAIITYLACCTRPDLAYAASQLGKVQSCPKQKHMDMLEHCVGYVKSTINFGIRYGTPKHEHVNRVHGHVDSSFNDDRDKCRSTGGSVACMNGGPVSWFARVMRTVALSSSEAELMACTEGGRDIVHLKQVCQGLGIDKGYSVRYGEDNTAALAMATDINQSVTTRSKHIALRHFWIRERTTTTPVYEHGYEDDEDAEADSPPDFKIFYVPSKFNTADMFTKSLPEPTFIQHRDSIMVELDETCSAPGMVEMANTCNAPGTAKPTRGPFPVNAYGLRNQFDHELAGHYYYW